jgi:hypothetical protein
MNIPGADLQYEIKFDNDFQGRARLTLSDTKADGYCVYARVAYNLQLWNDREVDLPVVCGVGKYYLATSRHTHPGAPFGLKIVSVRLYLCLQRFGNRVGCTREEFINNMLCGTCNDKRLSERPPMALDERIKDLARMEL